MAEIKNSQKFKTVTTNLGRNAVALAHGSGTSVRLTHMAVGDGKGKEIEPIATMTELVHEVHRGAINDIIILEDKPGEFIAELLIPQNIGGFFIREVGLFLEDGTLFAIGSTPLTEKTEISSGAASDLLVRMIIRIIDSGVIEIVIDPTQVLATRDYVDRSIQKGIDNHNKDENAHKPLFDKIKGLITSAGQSMQTHLTDPNAHKALFDAIKGQISAIPKISLANIISPADTTKAVTGKAVADYAAGKNVDNIFTRWAEFVHDTLVIRVHNYVVGGDIPTRNEYAYIPFKDKNGIKDKSNKNNLGGVGGIVDTRGSRHAILEAYFDDIATNARLGVTLNNKKEMYGYCPTPQPTQIGNYIATTAWVKNNSKEIKLVDTRETIGVWTLTNLKINVPLYILTRRNAPFGVATLDVQAPGGHDGVAYGAGVYYLGEDAIVKGTDCFIVIPNATTIDINVKRMDNTVLLRAYQ